MIATAADYDFVDWASGDMPTANVDGAIMPLRVGAAQNILKGEDVAFLVECVRDKAGAFSGLRFPSKDWTPSGTAVSPVSLTRKISSSQMTGIRSYLAGQMATGIPSGLGVGYLKDSASISAYPNFGQSSDLSSLISLGHGFFKAAYEGVWNPSTAAADFAVGAKVAKSPMLAMFDDAKHLARPVFRSGAIGDPFIGTSDMQTVTLSSAGGMQPPTGFIGYDARWSSDSNYCTSRGESSGAVAITLPKTYLSDAHAWLLYHAVNEWQYYSGGHYIRSRCGLIDLEQYTTRLSANDLFIWTFTAYNSRALLSHVMSLYNWQYFDVGSSGVTMQRILPMWDCAIYIEGTPNGRTKWWS